MLDAAVIERPLRLPNSLDEIDAKWLTAALNRKFPGTIVTNVVFGSTIHSTGTKLRLLLEYNDAGHAHRLPATMYFKGGYEDHSESVRTSHRRESMYYEEIRPLNLVNSPQCYFAGVDEETGYGAQLIEDLLQRNARFGDALHLVTVDQAAAALDQLAHLHAHWWNSPELERLGPAGGSFVTDGILLEHMGKDNWDKVMLTERGDDVPKGLRTQAEMIAAFESLWHQDRTSKYRCVVHGDCHPGNLFYEPDGRPGFLDWQRMMQCDWAHDLNYYLVSSLTIDDCAGAEEKLVRDYLAILRSLGVDTPSWDDAWVSYRKHTIHGMVWNVCWTSMQTKEIIDVISKRFNVAAGRLDCQEALARG